MTVTTPMSPILVPSALNQPSFCDPVTVSCLSQPFPHYPFPSLPHHPFLFFTYLVQERGSGTIQKGLVEIQRMEWKILTNFMDIWWRWSSFWLRSGYFRDASDLKPDLSSLSLSLSLPDFFFSVSRSRVLTLAPQSSTSYVGGEGGR